jgi:two-component system sensor histidine kinase SenX3
VAAPLDAGAFLSQVVHHLRAPVAVSRTMLSLLSQGYAGKMDAQQADLVRRVEARMAYLQTLIDDLVDLTSIRAGLGMVGGPTPLDVLVHDVCARFEPAARAKGIGLELERPSTSILVSAAAGVLDPLVTQLIRNAVTYTTSGAVRVSIEHDSRFARLVVSDDGIGIPVDDRARVFEEFYRAPNAKALEDLGTGLGLPIVRAAACRTGATIECNSAEGKGTTFAVLLPRATGASKAVTRTAARRKGAGRRWPRS